MSRGWKCFQVGEAKTQPNGDITLVTLPCVCRPKTSTQPVSINRTIPPSRLDPGTVEQLESNAVSDRTQESDEGQLKINPPSRLDPVIVVHPESNTVSDRIQEGGKGQPITNSQSLCDVDTALSEIANRQPPRKLNGTNEDPFEPILTPDTYLLTTHAGKATWTQLGTITIGTTVVQSLPSGRTEDLGEALVMTMNLFAPTNAQQAKPP